MKKRISYEFWFNLISLIITIATVCILMGKILERIDNVIIRLNKIEEQQSLVIQLDKRVAIIENKLYNIENKKGAKNA